MKNPGLSSRVLDEIVAIGQRTSPREAVGVLRGDRVIELPNHSQNPESSFVLDMGDLVFELENLGLEMSSDDWLGLVVWHTHPRGLVGPSRFDMTHRVPNLTHLVVALTTAGPIPAMY